MSDASSMSLIEVRDAIRNGDLTAESAASSCLHAISDRDGGIGAFLQVFDDAALESARAVDRGERTGSLAGVPIALKDNICLNHGRTTCASRMLETYESPFTATAAQRLIDAGAVIIGKTNLDEFAMGSSTENSAFHITRNPVAPDRVPGGSSGGSAAAVAAGFVPGALGSDTGGSIRQPAALTGVVGMKPTYGRVSRWGLVAFASSLDQIGPFGRTVADVALLMDVIAGFDELDSTSSPRAGMAVSPTLSEPVGKLRIGVPRQVRSEHNHPAVVRALDAAITTCTSMGAEVVDVDLPRLDDGIAAYYVVATAEASSNLARFDGIRYGHRAALSAGEGLEDLYARSRAEGFGPEVQRRIMLGTYALSSGYYDAYYRTAMQVRRLIRDEFDAIFASGVHAVMMPSTANPAFRIGEKVDDPLQMYLEDLYTVTANLAGVPAISVPAGVTTEEEGDGTALPVAMQFVGPVGGDEVVLRVGAEFEGGRVEG